MRIDIDGSLKFYQSKKILFFIFLGAVFTFAILGIFYGGIFTRNKMLFTVSFSLMAFIIAVQIFVLKMYPFAEITGGGLKVRGWPYLKWDDIKTADFGGDGMLKDGVKIELKEDSPVRKRVKNPQRMIIKNYYFEHGDKRMFVDEILKRLQSEQETEQFLNEAYEYDKQL